MLLQFCPDAHAPSVTEITAEYLAQHSIRALILDLDNTLVPWHGYEVAPSIAEWVRRMQAAGVKLCIVSNTHRPRRLEELAALLGIAWVPSGGKPGRRGFYRAMAAMGAAAKETAVIGDQLITDIWGGNRCGLLTILVDPLSSVEFWGTRVINRSLERLLLKHLERRGIRTDAVGEAESGREYESGSTGNCGGESE